MTGFGFDEVGLLVASQGVLKWVRLGLVKSLGYIAKKTWNEGPFPLIEVFDIDARPF